MCVGRGRSKDLGPLRVKLWNAIIAWVICKANNYWYVTSTQRFVTSYSVVIATVCCLPECCTADSGTTEVMLGNGECRDLPLTQITGSLLLVGSETAFSKFTFTTTYCCCTIWSSSSFHLASMVAAKDTSRMFLPILSWGHLKIMISLTWLNNSNYVFCNFSPAPPKFQ